MASLSKNIFRYSNVGISDKLISEYEGDVETVTIPLHKIRKITLEYGNPVERPIRNLLVCILTLGGGITLGIMPLYHVILSSKYPDTGYSLKLFAFAIPLTLLGGWYFIQFFQKRYYLNVETENRKRKIVFESNTNKQKIFSFINKVERAFSIKIRNNARIKN